MCELMTLACATAMVAGSVASAAERTVATKVAPVAQTAQQSIPQSAKELVGASLSPDVFSAGGGCTCLWDNGAFDGRDGQVSHLGGFIPYGAKAADDFYLCEGFVYDLQYIRATLFTTTLPAPLLKAKAEIYADCDGKPGQLLYTLDGVGRETGGSFGTNPRDNRPLRLVEWTFSANSSQTDPNARNIVLKGGSYWVSVYGLTDGQCMTMNMCDITYWGTAGNRVVKGAVAMKTFGSPTSSWNQFNFNQPWTRVDDCCVGCTDLNFAVCATPCKILVDNGELRRVAAGSPVPGQPSEFAIQSWSTLQTRAADDFVVPPCSDYRICYVEGCVLTNCVGFTGVFELYGNDCKVPNYALNGSSLNGQLYTATKVIDLNYSITVNGQTYKAYKLEFHDLNIVLPGGRQYWISVGVQHTFSALERAFFCFNSDCRRSCLVRWNRGMYLNNTTRSAYNSNVFGWADAGSDFAFLIAADRIGTEPGAAGASCAADFNRDAAVDILDVFDFLQAWFNGCP
jgi:hypothetical protein